MSVVSVFNIGAYLAAGAALSKTNWKKVKEFDAISSSIVLALVSHVASLAAYTIVVVCIF